MELKELKEKYKQLGEAIEKMEAGELKLELKTKGYYTTEMGSVHYAHYDVQLYNASVLNFPTEQDALDDYERRLAEAEWWKLSRHLNGDWRPDWNNHMEVKYSVFFHRCLVVSSNIAEKHRPNHHYFHSHELAEQFLELASDRLKKYIKER